MSSVELLLCFWGSVYTALAGHPLRHECLLLVFDRFLTEMQRASSLIRMLTMHLSYPTAVMPDSTEAQ
jgi:hypothetical protein